MLRSRLLPGVAALVLVAGLGATCRTPLEAPPDAPGPLAALAGLDRPSRSRPT